MNIKACLLVCAALLVVSGSLLADEATDEYQKLMKPGAAANTALQKAANTDLAAAAQAATDMQAAFAKIEEYWSQKGTEDAVAAAKSVQAIAKEAHDAAASGDKDATVAAAKKVGAACGSCHMAHRTRLPDGTFELKP
jgi:cytochrome c556